VLRLFQATAAVETGKRASAAWELLRVDTSVRKMSRMMSPTVDRSSSLIAAYTSIRERINDVAPGDELQEEAEDALAHLANGRTDGQAAPTRGDGYRISVIPSCNLLMSKFRNFAIPVARFCTSKHAHGFCAFRMQLSICC
jgi:hypothetical protein